MTPRASPHPGPVANPLLAAARSAWPLLAGMALLMLGQGLQNSLLGVRATIEGFPIVLTGFVMSGYYSGFFAGSLFAPRLLRRSGHVRLFAVLAGVAALSIVVHGLVLDPIVWTGLRAVSGFCFSGLYIVIESWLNGRADNQNRGSLLSLYMIVQLSGLSGGYLLLNVGDPAGFLPFALSAALMAAGMAPLALLQTTTGPAPAESRPMSLLKLLEAAPVGLLVTFAVGGMIGAYGGLGAAYAEGLGFSTFAVSLFMLAFTLGGTMLQVPLGLASDRFARPAVIAASAALASLVALAAARFGGVSPAALIACGGVFGALALPIYALGIAEANDHLSEGERVDASAGLIMAYGAGSIFGPLAAASATKLLGPPGFFVCLAVTAAAIAAVALAGRPLADRLFGAKAARE